eukprot:TRINITY_DN101_c0_g1_i1.p1 TRINITY_DN101_c0_g1~~TRINITY_DN101_c0_g1_i1.p1  ORF type:complete len:189 (-),score=61.31 TRINITY_DN101_c0_g1_i1:89-655(-)
MSRGKEQNAKLISNVEDQLVRLVTQLKDLEDLKAEVDEEEYQSLKKDTIVQLKEFQASLQKMMQGDMTLVDALGSVQLAIQAAVSQAFHTPEVIKLFAKKQPGQLRQRLANLQRDVKLKTLSNEAYTQQAVEILSALKKLGEKLSAEELSFLNQNMTQSLADFEKASDGVEQGRILSMAQKDIQKNTN